MLSTYDHETSCTCSSWVKDVPYWFRGQKVKSQGRGALMIKIGFPTITDPVIHLWSWNFMHLLLMSQGCDLLIRGQKVKGQGSGALMIKNSFWTITDPVIHLWSWNFMHLLPMSQGCALLISGSKGQGHGALKIENGFWTYDHETSYTCSP